MTDRKKIEEHIDNLKKDYYSLFTSDVGKRVLADLSNFCGQNRPSVNEQLPNELQTFYAEGKRRVYLRILSLMEK